MRDAYKKLGTNISLFTISSFGTKILNFLLVPLYTSCLTISEYGIVDLLSTVVQLLVPIFTLDIADSVIRFSLENKSEEDDILPIAIRIILLGMALVIALLFAISWLFNVTFSTTYLVFILASFFLTSIYNTMTSYFRGRDKVTDVVVAGLMCTLVTGINNVVLLYLLHWRILGYLISNLLGILIPTVYLLVRAFRFKYLQRIIKPMNSELLKKMLVYCSPLIINTISWWINNSLDKFFVSSMCGIDANGLLAVSYKIPSVLAMFQTIFNQAWTMSAVQEFDSEDKHGFLSNTYCAYGCMLTMACSLILLINVPMASFLYAKDFFVAWKYTGMLVIAQLFAALSVCVSGVFNAVKDSKSLAFSTFLGAITNIILNYALIKTFGIQGAVLATLLSNVVVWGYRVQKVKEYVQLKLNLGKDIISYGVLFLQCIFGLSATHAYWGQLACIVILIAFYWKQILQLSGLIWHKFFHRN